MLVKQERENTDKKKTKKNNIFLKHRSQKNQIKKSHNSNCKHNDSHTCLKTIKKQFFYFSDNVLNEKKQAKGKNNPKLLTVQT